jgi:hypothetical protein
VDDPARDRLTGSLQGANLAGKEKPMIVKASVGLPVALILPIWAIATLPAFAQGRIESFDKAIKVTEVDLGSSSGPGRHHGQLRCHYFPGFVVKELDSGQKGDDWISIAPNDPSHPASCSQEHASGETVLQDWEGYFGGVKEGLIFLDAADCSDRGCPFRVYEASTSKKLFEDQRRLSPKGKIAEIRFIRNGEHLVMRYPRVVTAECSLPQKKTVCWKQILSATGLNPQPIPNCIGYSGFIQREGYGTNDLTDPSVVSFPVEITIPGFNARILPGPAECWAAD